MLPPDGRHGHSHPPLPRLAPSGGDEEQGERWEHLHAWPSKLLHRPWQWPLLCMVRQTRQPEVVPQVGERCGTPYPNGRVSNVHKGTGPAQSPSVARSVATDVGSPPLAVWRLERDDGARGTSHDRAHQTERVEHDTVAVDTCMGRLVPHTRPTGFKRMRE